MSFVLKYAIESSNNIQFKNKKVIHHVIVVHFTWINFLTCGIPILSEPQKQNHQKKAIGNVMLYKKKKTKNQQQFYHFFLSIWMKVCTNNVEALSSTSLRFCTTHFSIFFPFFRTSVIFSPFTLMHTIPCCCRRRQLCAHFIVYVRYMIFNESQLTLQRRSKMFWIKQKNL